MNSVYPVGSLFFCTQSTCPLQTLGIGTWTIAGTSIVRGGDVPVVGNGVNGIGLIQWTGSDFIEGTIAPNNAGVGAIGNRQPLPLDLKVAKYAGWGNNNTYPLGVTTEPEKSGMIADLSYTAITINIFKRTA